MTDGPLATPFSQHVAPMACSSVVIARPRRTMCAAAAAPAAAVSKGVLPSLLDSALAALPSQPDQR